VSAWEEVVTTALLGTDRRRPPDELPPAVARLATGEHDAARAVLAVAAGLAVRRLAGARPTRAPAPDAAPRQTIDFAPEGAQRLLALLLEERQTALVDVWLRHCTDRGLGVRPRLWCSLATAAASPRGPDRHLVREALGARGRAFLALRPEWAVVLRPPGSRTVPAAAEPDPAELSALPGPWSEAVAAAALRHLDDGELPLSQARALAVALALRAPLTFRDDVQRMPFPDAVRAMSARLEIIRSFDVPEQESP